MEAEQIEFEAIAHLVPSHKQDKHRPVRKTPLVDAVDPVLLNRALTAERVAFPTVAIMLAVVRLSHGQPVKTASLSDLTGYSSNAIRHQVRRTPWWDIQESPYGISLNDEGKQKLTRIQKRLK